MAPRITTLPGEIRNRIYQYVLSDSDGLMIWIDPAGTQHLCRQNARECATFVYLFSNQSDRSMINFNQLQYVNRLFWAETQGLECRYNKIYRRRAATARLNYH
jgi:hypothetical protein